MNLKRATEEEIGGTYKYTFVLLSLFRLLLSRTRALFMAMNVNTTTQQNTFLATNNEMV